MQVGLSILCDWYLDISSFEYGSVLDYFVMFLSVSLDFVYNCARFCLNDGSILVICYQRIIWPCYKLARLALELGDLIPPS